MVIPSVSIFIFVGFVCSSVFVCIADLVFSLPKDNRRRAGRVALPEVIEPRSGNSRLIEPLTSLGKNEVIRFLCQLPWNEAIPAMLVIYMKPETPQIEEVIRDARRRVLRFKEYQPAERSIRAIYDALARRGINFDVSRVNNPHHTILLPHVVLAGEPPCDATPLDMAILLASCMEAAGMEPLIFFLHGPDGENHAIVGYWNQSLPLQGRSVVYQGASCERILSLIVDGTITVIEIGGLLAADKWAFTNAKEEAIDLLNRKEWIKVFVLDVFKAREQKVLQWDF
ncbi:MAG: hypothetical protein L0177_03755 [Chloroflexi bacterium]|nr:hypothetical protein [Chloroflexota bacterium]